MAATTPAGAGGGSSGLAGALSRAAAFLKARRPQDALQILEPLARENPGSADAAGLYAVSLALLRKPAAEEALRKAIALGSRPELHLALGDLLAVLGREAEAVAAYREALTLDPRHPQAARQLMLLLAARGSPEDALAVPDSTPGAALDYLVLDAQAEILKQTGQLEAALEVRRRSVLSAPGSGLAEHNLGALLGDLGRHREAVEAAGRALGKGLDAPETHLVLARALVGAGRHDEAEAAFRGALARRPLYVEALRDYAQLIWMRTGDVAAASAPIDAAARAAPGALAPDVLKAKLRTSAGDAAGALAVLEAAVARAPGEAALRIAASQAALQAGRPEEGLAHAEAVRPATEAERFKLGATLCEALLATGDARAAEGVAQGLLDRSPLFQPGLAYLATAWRILGDPRYSDLYDYGAFVGSYTIEAPKGWTGLEAYLADLARELALEHSLIAHPFDQSLRGGSQVSDVLHIERPALQAFAEAVEPAISTFLQALGQGPGPFRSRNRGRHLFSGAWSIRLRSGGRHVDHVHPEGWISSACYIALPAAQRAADPQGFIKFGEPGIPTRPNLGPELFIRPEPGRLVLFPSYMWHGTVPFEAAGERLTLAFDLTP